MRAVVFDRYGPPEVLRIDKVERPVPAAGEVLVKVHATSVTRTDTGLRSAEFFFSRLFTGVRGPKKRFLGIELAGVVEQVGPGVTEFAPGDRVFGVKSGAHAEYVCVRAEGALAHMPAGLGFTEAAAACDGAALALACLRKANVDAGDRVVVYGASGAVGTAGVQLAKHLGAHVTAVTTPTTIELIRSLGADEVIDYTREDFTQNGETYDVVFDAVGKHSFRRSRRSLKPGGTVRRHRPRVHVAPAADDAAHPLRRRQARPARHHEVLEGGRAPPQAADRGRRVPAGDRPDVPVRAGHRGDEVRGDRPEDRQRRADADRRRGGAGMRAVIQDRYGPPEILRVEEVAKPTPGPGEVLVKVHASTVNRSDCGFRAAKPFFSRAFTGLRRPKLRIAGMELAGVVEATGPGVTEFKVGDEVFGVRSGAQADYVCVREQGALAHKPSRLAFEEAAAVPDGAIIARACLDKGRLRQGQSIVIYGASGSIGTAAVQIAKARGAHVTAVCNAKNVELVRSLGADEVIDYEQDDFTKNGKTYDVVLDAVGKHSFRRARRSVRPGGVFVETDLGFMWHAPLLALLTRWVGSKRVTIPIPQYTQDNVVFVKELIEAGKYRPVIDRRYSLDAVVEATKYVETGEKTGNVVLTLTGAAPQEVSA